MGSLGIPVSQVRLPSSRPSRTPVVRACISVRSSSNSTFSFALPGTVARQDLAHLGSTFE